MQKLIGDIMLNIKDFSVEDFKSSIPNNIIEDIKNKEILNVASQCVAKMIEFSSEKLEESHSIIVNLNKTQQDIQNTINQTIITTNEVIVIVKKVLSYKEELEFLGMFISGLMHLFPLFHILTMFLF